MQNLLKKGVIVESTHEPNEYISPIFLRPKKDGSHRLILNLKTQKIKEACQKHLQSPQPTIREVARVIGMLTASFPGVMFGPLHRHLDMDKTVALKLRKGNYNKTMTLSDEAS